jgi:hypothetical protein
MFLCRLVFSQGKSAQDSPQIRTHLGMFLTTLGNALFDFYLHEKPQ